MSSNDPEESIKRAIYCQELIYIPTPEVLDYSAYFDRPQFFLTVLKFVYI
jgi:hypothetical protein